MTRILVPLDGGPFAEQALRTAIAIARRDRASLDLVYVQPALLPPDPELSITRLVEIRTATRDEIRRHLAEVAARTAKESGLAVTSEVLDGDPATELAQFAGRNRVDLIVMCTHGRGPAARLWLGSVADRLLRIHSGNILFVPAGPDAGAEPPFRSALIPLDGSTLSEEAIAPALRLLAPGARVLLARNVEPPVVATFAFEMPVLPPAIPLTALWDAARSYLQARTTLPRSSGMDVHTIVGDGPNAAEWILEVARKEKVGLIAIATHGLGGLRRAMLGSVADKVIRGAPVAVLACRPGGNA
jgi:nucleotide-binding universal stress UspA family protein